MSTQKHNAGKTSLSLINDGLMVLVQGCFFIDTNAKWSYGRTVHFIDMRFFLQIVAIEGEFRLIYDTWPLFQSVLVEKRIPKKGGNRVLGKQVLAELRRANDFFW